MSENLSIQEYANLLAENAREASQFVRALSADTRNQVLFRVAKLLRERLHEILAANAVDVEAAEGNLSPSMVDRLTLNPARIEAMAKGVEEIAAFTDPLNRVLEKRTLKNGLDISRVSVPIGTIFFIYESRPNVTIDGAALCFKSGNAVILRGGKESLASSKYLTTLFREALQIGGVHEDAVQLVRTPDRELMRLLLQKNEEIDLVIPRGGEGLIRAVVEQSRIPVIKHFNGICHIYVDKSAKFSEVGAILENAKVQRPSVCNTMETLLIDRAIDDNVIRDFLSPLVKKEVQFFGDAEVCSRIENVHEIEDMSHYRIEYLDLKLSIRFVGGVEEACAHIEKYSSRHTEAILAEDTTVQNYFIQHVDSSSVMINASTRFADGGEYGLGAEVGISTDKLHARGPMGMESLCTYQWIVRGNGQIRE
ncbi:MAG: glutamate-5-semialdehyde dehydrogenase [Fibrobacter sp.]|jgi:glutamate-5-semialdehyde dehydrogenase|nr:glutamate-5-semialdehyde dehydrogenase [Fibrobacter sp.]